MVHRTSRVSGFSYSCRVESFQRGWRRRAGGEKGGISGRRGGTGAVIEQRQVPGLEDGDGGRQDQGEELPDDRDQGEDAGNDHHDHHQHDQGDDVGDPPDLPDGGKDGIEVEGLPHLPRAGKADDADDGKESQDLSWRFSIISCRYEYQENLG